MAAPSRLQLLRFGKEPFDQTHRFETSWLLPPCVLFCFRAAFAVYAFTVLFVIIGAEASTPIHGVTALKRSFSYFTVISYWGLAFYFLTSSIYTLTYILSPTSRSLLARLPRPLQALHSLFHTSILVYPPLISLTFWLVIHCNACLATQFSTFTNISQHALNTVFALFELFVTRTVPPLPIHLLWLELGVAGYLGVAYVTRATQGWYTYLFLDPSDGHAGRVAGSVVGVGAALVVIFVVIWGVIWMRVRVTEGMWDMRGKLKQFEGEGMRGEGIETDRSVEEGTGKEEVKEATLEKI